MELAIISVVNTAADSDIGKHATQALAAVILLAASAGTTCLYMIAYLVHTAASYSTMTTWIYQLSVVLDVPFDAALALSLGDLPSPTRGRWPLSTAGTL